MFEKINYSRLGVNDLKSYSDFAVDKTDLLICRSPLFHGSTEKAIDCNPEIMQLIHDHSLIIIKAAKDFYAKNSNDPAFKNELKDYVENTGNDVFCDGVTCEFGISSLYSYGDFYVTTNFEAAMDYAELTFGELALRAYYNACGLRTFKANADIEASISFIIDKYDEFKNSPKAVLLLRNVSFDDLRSEGGHPLNSDRQRKRIYEADAVVNCNLRVMNVFQYTLELFSEDLFAEAKQCFL